MGKVISLTEDQILLLSNNIKREEFLKQQNEIWLEIPELSLKFIKITLPDMGTSVIITLYKSQYYNDDIRDYRIVNKKNPYSAYSQSMAQIVDLLKNFSKSIKEKRKKEGGSGSSGSRISIYECS